jgi:hypothetical protein
MHAKITGVMSTSSIKGNRFHPFQKPLANPKPNSSATISNPASHVSYLHSSPLLDYLGYRIHTKHLVVICVSCECGVLPGNAISHVKKKHNIPVSQENRALWDLSIVDWNIDDEGSIPSPTDREPVELLKVHPKAFSCNNCDYVCLTESTFSKHWGVNHKNATLPPKERYHESWAETFYPHVPCRYFEVDVPIPNSTPAFDVYMKKEVPSYPSFDVTIPSAPREIPPLLYTTRWHEHLEEYMTDKPKRRLLYSVAHPTKFTNDRLWDLVWRYLDVVSLNAKDSSMRVRCLLTEYPRCVADNFNCNTINMLNVMNLRTALKAEPWKYHLTKDTQRLYAYPLHSLAYSVLAIHKGHPTNYEFPLPPDYTQCITALETCLQEAHISEEHVVLFHNFIYPLLSSQPSILEEDKWTMVLECWLALYALQIEGNFSDASTLTGVLAKMEYHCRAVTFYQGYLHRTEFPNNSLYLCVFCLVMLLKWLYMYDKGLLNIIAISTFVQVDFILLIPLWNINDLPLHLLMQIPLLQQLPFQRMPNMSHTRIGQWILMSGF